MHADSVHAADTAILTPDRFPLARGQWLHAEAWGLTDELRDLRYALLLYSVAPKVARRARRILNEDRARYASYEPEQVAELRELDDAFARWIAAWWEKGFRCADVTVDAAELAALRIEAAAQATLRTLGEGKEMPLRAMRDLTMTVWIARDAISLAASRKRAKEIQQQAATPRRPLALCTGDTFGVEWAGCGRVFADRFFPDAAGRGPNGRMFRYWCDEHQGGSSRNLRQRAATRYLLRRAELPKHEQAQIERLEEVLSGVTEPD